MADITFHDVLEALRSVADPELGISIVDLGLIRDVDVSAEHIQIVMTLTTPACPYVPQLIAETERTASALPGGRRAVVHLEWEPPWNPRTDASEDGLAALGVW
jgi:metal-sulfur cluster biosynthetic enzyme